MPNVKKRDLSDLARSAGYTPDVDLDAAAEALKQCVLEAAKLHSGTNYTSGSIGPAGQAFVASEAYSISEGWVGNTGHIKVDFKDPMRRSLIFNINNETVNAIKILDGGMAVSDGKHAPPGGLDIRGATNFLSDAAAMFKARYGEEFHVVSAWAE